MILSIIIPVFNEESTIVEVFKRVQKVNLKNIKKEIIVVDDASTDGSFKKVKKLKNIVLLRQKKNMGKGAAIRMGLSKATGDFFIIQDADLEYSPSDYEKLLTPILQGRTEVVYGTRLKTFPLRVSGSKRTPLVSHYLGNILLTSITNFLYGSELTDMETCYKVFKKEALQGITIESNRFEFEPEITAKLLRKGIKIMEVPIKVKPRGYDEGKKISWKDGFSALYTLLKYRL